MEQGGQSKELEKICHIIVKVNWHSAAPMTLKYNFFSNRRYVQDEIKI